VERSETIFGPAASNGTIVYLQELEKNKNGGMGIEKNQIFEKETCLYDHVSTTNST
jgi:hypothetical protein